MDACVRTGRVKGVTREQIRSAAAEKSVMCVAKTEGSSKRQRMSCKAASRIYEAHHRQSLVCHFPLRWGDMKLVWLVGRSWCGSTLAV